MSDQQRGREMDAALHLKLGELAARVGHLEKGVEALQNDMKIVLEALAQAKGGWKVLALAGAAGGAIATFAIKMVPWLGAVVR